MVRQGVIFCDDRDGRTGCRAPTATRALAPLAGAPFLDHLLAEIGRHDVGDLLLVTTGDTAPLDAFLAGSPVATRLGLAVAVVALPPGTDALAALRALGDRLADRFFLFDGDRWVDALLADLAAAAQGLDPYLAADVVGAWNERMMPDGSFRDEPSPASSLYHLTCAIAELDDVLRPNAAR